MGRTSTAPLRLQEALIALVWKQCYSHVTIDAICEKAKVKKGSFYYFYKSKAELAAQAFDRHWNVEIQPQLDEIFSATRPPTERLEGLIEAEIALATRQQEEDNQILGCPFCNIGQEISTLEPELGAIISTMLERFHIYISSTLRDAVAEGSSDVTDVESTSFAIYSFFQGSFTQARIHNSLKPLYNLRENVGRLAGLSLYSKEAQLVG